MKTMIAANRDSVLAILAEEYGITDAHGLNEAMRKMQPMNLTSFCSKSEISKGDKDNDQNGKTT